MRSKIAIGVVAGCLWASLVGAQTIQECARAVYPVNGVLNPLVYVCAAKLWGPAQPVLGPYNFKVGATYDFSYPEFKMQVIQISLLPSGEQEVKAVWIAPTGFSGLGQTFVFINRRGTLADNFGWGAQ